MVSRPAHTCGDTRVFSKLFGLMAALLFLTFTADAAGAITYYVDADSLGGPSSDGNPGTMSQPFKTVEKARDTIRATGADGVTVYLRGGTYYLTRPLQFDARDSGTAGAPNVYTAYPGEKPIVSGGRKLTSTWTQASGNIYVTSVGTLRFHSLFVNGRRAIRAREPDVGSYTIAGVNAATSSQGFYFNPGQINGSWHDLRNVEIVSLRTYIQSRLRIDRVEGNAVYVRDAPNYPFDWPPWVGPELKTYYVENVLEGLDQPGEWYLDNANGWLYYWPLDGQNPQNSAFMVPTLGYQPAGYDGQLLNVKGTAAANVQYLRFEGITFAHTDWSLPIGYKGWQSAWLLEECGYAAGYAGVGPAVSFIYTQNCAFRNGRITHTGGNALNVFSRYLEVSGNEIDDAGANGVRVGTWDFRMAYSGLTSNNVIRDNVIHDVGRVFEEGTGIFVLISGNNTIAHNLVYNTPYLGISVGWGWDSADTSCVNNLVQYNEVHHAMQVLSDGAGMYFLGKQPGTIISNNKIHDVPHDSGFYIDEGGQAITFRSNWVYRTYAGLLLHACLNNTIENNVFTGVKWTYLLYSGGSGNRFARNIVHSPVTAQLFSGAPGTIAYSNFNLYYNAVQWSPTGILQTWKTNTGYDLNSIERDPLFVNYAGDNFNLQASSPAFSLGYQQIDMSGVGPQSTTRVITATAGTGGSITPSGTVSVAQGASQTFTMQASTGYSISRVDVDGVSVGAVSQYTFSNVTANHTINAVFAAVPATYTVNVSATNGSVAKTPNQTSYTSGQSVSLQATPNTGYNFTGWSGDLTGTANPATLVMNSNKSVTAGFAANSYTLTINATNGSVSKSPNAATYGYGAVVTLQAVPNTGYTFSGWSGDASGTSTTTTVTMTANKTVTANFTAIPVTYTLNVSATNGSVTKTPDQASYTSGQSVTLQAAPSTGYTFAGWSGDLTGTTNPATLVMNANKTVTANFTAVVVTYTLSVSAANGAVIKTPDKTSYASGETVTLQAVPNAGYQFTGWSGSLTGTANPATLVMNSNKSVTAGFVANTYTLSVSAANGTVTRTPEKTSYLSGETVTLQAVPNTGYKFVSWSGDLTGTANPATLMMNANKAVTAGFTSTGDQAPPVLGNCAPAPDSIQAPPNTLVTLHLRDDGQGVDEASVSITVDGQLVYSGSADLQRTVAGVCYRSGTKADYTYIYQRRDTYGYSREVVVKVSARDLAGNVMPEQTYSFATEMYSFGRDRSVSTGQTSLNQGRPATVSDSRGNLWIVWHAGNTGARQIYVARFLPDADTYNPTVQLSRTTGDHCNPVVAIDGAETLYVVWQENARGVWDVYLSTSTDGNMWSAPKRIVDPAASTRPAFNQSDPALAVSRQASRLVAIAWQDDRAGNPDVYVARSTNAFTTITISRVTSDSASQSDPAVAIDGQDTVFVLWTDARNGATDIYGAASNSGPWTNTPVVTGPGNQSQPVVAAASTGSLLHLAWVDDRAGDPDIFSATSQGLPAGSLTGTNIGDDTSRAGQQAPALVVAARADGADKIFACWQDGRNIATSGDADLYFADLSPGALSTNVLLEDEGTNSDQSGVALAVNGSGYPYAVWSDDRGKNRQIYYSGATYMEGVPLAQKEISAAAGDVVGTPPESIKTLDEVSVVIPAQACPFNGTISIRRMRNPHGYASESLRIYDFGPSGLTFSQPVTITIPYPTRGSGKVRAYWFDSATSAFTDQGVTNVQDIAIASGLHALRFNTTHFTPYVVMEEVPGATGGSGGGCSLTVGANEDVAGYFAPYLLLAAVMLILRHTDRRRRLSAGHEDDCHG